MIRKLLLATLALALLAPGTAAANDRFFTMVMDDDQFIYRGDDVRDAYLKRAKDLGADYVRVTLLWSVVAEKARDTKAKDKRFRELGADNPKAYPKLNWDRFDRLVRATKTLGIGLYFNVTGPGPEWGHRKPPKSQARNRATWMPKEREFYKFVQAVGTRYSGKYRDENDGRFALPRVDFWSLWNEPNQGGWLTPQYYKGQAYSAQMFRKLYIFGHRALESTGHGQDTILLGETAPLGSSKKTTRSPIKPQAFIRELFCVDKSLQPLEGSGADARGCDDFDRYGPLLATAFAHHPYTKNVSPLQPPSDPDWLTMANIKALPALLDQISANTARVRPGMPIMSTEFGFETNPPDPFSGIDPNTAATWLSLGDLLTFSEPRLIANTQFLIRDVAPVKSRRKDTKAYWFTYQSGLFDLDDQAKPLATAFTFPFLAFTAGPANELGQVPVGYWGQLRFLPNTLSEGNPASFAFEWRPIDGTAGFTPVGDPVSVTNPSGFFQGTIAVPGAGFVRASWTGAGLPEFTSREFAVGA